jgi:hypothetical protein
MKRALLAAFAALCLAGCNASGPAASRAAAASQPAPNSIDVAPSNFQMPQGAGCAGAVARYRAVQDDDLAMGQIAQSVYDEVHKETAAAAEACAGGHDAEARAMIAASRKRHGYPASL